MAGGQLLGAALGLLSELVKQNQQEPPQEAVVQKIAESLQDGVERDELGRPQLTVRLENEDALRNLAKLVCAFDSWGKSIKEWESSVVAS